MMWCVALAAFVAVNEHTPYQGYCYVAQDVADCVWQDTGDDTVLRKNGRAQAIPYGTTVDFGSKYVMPQASKQNIIVNYTIQNGTNNAAGDKRTMNYVVKDNTDGGWKAGHGYTYLISIGQGGNLNLSNVSVKTFTEGNTGTTVID